MTERTDKIEMVEENVAYVLPSRAEVARLATECANLSSTGANLRYCHDDLGYMSRSSSLTIFGLSDAQH